MITVALGILLAVAAILVVWVALQILLVAYVFLWHGIDDYGPVQHWFRKVTRR